jgi:hypothetical protein
LREKKIYCLSENGQIIFLGQAKITVVDKSILENTTEVREISVGEMHKRRETMADNRRYMVYYTFETKDESGTINDEETTKIAASSSAVTDASAAENV